MKNGETGGPTGYVAAMAKDQPWESENTFLNAVLVSVMRREKKMFEVFVKQGGTFEIIPELNPSRRILVYSKGTIVGVVSYRGNSVPREIATRVLVVLYEFSGRRTQLQTPSEDKRGDMTEKRTTGQPKPEMENNKADEYGSLPKDTVEDLNSYRPPTGFTPIIFCPREG